MLEFLFGKLWFFFVEMVCVYGQATLFNIDFELAVRGGLGNDDGELRFVGTEMLGKEFDTCGILGAELIKYMHMGGTKIIVELKMLRLEKKFHGKYYHMKE